MPAEGEEMRHPQAASRDDAAQATSDILVRLRARAPRVHCITNAVAQSFTANALLAAGCVPSMTLSAEEIASFVASAQALLVNLGTFDAERREATAIALQAATTNKVPWVLDPVFVDRSEPRAAFARELIARRPAVVRMNHAEFSALADAVPSRDSTLSYARSNRIVLAVSGETDLITDGQRIAGISNGHPLMSKVTAMGCAGSAVLAACLAVEADTFRAAIAGLAIIGVIGELAAERSSGPGSFAVAIIDALHGLDAATFIARERIS
jgi:hydroxyethylthiazole kinase